MQSVRCTCCSASMRESSLSCRARSELASSPCSAPTPLVLAGTWLGWLGWLGKGWLAYGSWQAGSWAAELPRMPSGGRGGVCGPATGARDRWEPDLVPRGDMASAQPRRARDAPNQANWLCCRPPISTTYVLQAERENESSSAKYPPSRKTYFSH